MTKLILPNDIEANTTADAAEVEQNFNNLENYVNSELINRDGSVAMQQPLLLPGDPTLPNQASNKGYVDGIDNLNVAKAGDTMSGPLIVTPAWVGARPDVATQALFTHKDSPGDATGFAVAADGNVHAVVVTGGNFNVYSTTTGPVYNSRLNVNDGGVTSSKPFFSTDTQSTNASALTRKDYVDAQVATALSPAEGDARYVNNVGDAMTGSLQINSGNLTLEDPTFTTPGATLTGSGSGTIAIAQAGRNLTLIKIGSPAADASSIYEGFYRGTTGVGSVVVASASSVAYNTTSDPRLKERTGDVDDAVDLVCELGSKAFRGRWIADEGTGKEWVFLNSTDIEAVAPYAVTGEANATDSEGEIVPQQADYPALVPLLFAALSNALDRIAVLEAAA